MITNALKKLFKRDLNKLIIEIELYKKERNLWILEEQISNSAGNLCLHIVGNLNHFIGSLLGNTGYIRQRELEFSQKNIAIEDLKAQVTETINMIDKVLNTLSSDALQKEYPLQVFGKPITTDYFLVHLAMHLSYHLGQINYHRRLLDT